MVVLVGIPGYLKNVVTTSGEEPASLNYELVAETPIEKKI